MLLNTKLIKKKNLQLILQPRNTGLSDFYIWQHIHKISDLQTRGSKSKMRKDNLFKSTQSKSQTNYTSIYTMHDTIIMNTDCTSFPPTCFIITFTLWSILLFQNTQNYCKVQQHMSSIYFSVAYYSVFGIIIINFTKILNPLFVQRSLPPVYCFVSQYS